MRTTEQQAELRACVVRLCERVLRATVQDARTEDVLAADAEARGLTVAELRARRAVDPDAFVLGFHEARQQRQREAPARRLHAQAARAVHAIKEALRGAPQLLEEAAALGLPETGYLAELRRLREAFTSLPYVGLSPQPHELEEDDGWTHRRHVLQEFDTDNFAGLRRRPTVAELAAVSLLLDPEHGCAAVRRQGELRAWKIVRQEKNAIMQAQDALLPKPGTRLLPDGRAIRPDGQVVRYQPDGQVARLRKGTPIRRRP